MHKYKTHLTYRTAHTRRRTPESIISTLLDAIFTKSPMSPVTIAIGGPGGTGKSTFAKKLAGLLANSAILWLDDYKTSRSVRADQNIFGAHPGANMMDLAGEHISFIKQGRAFDKPVYDTVAGTCDRTERFTPAAFTCINTCPGSGVRFLVSSYFITSGSPYS